MRHNLRHASSTLKLLCETDRSAFVVGTLTSVIQSVIYPLLLVLVWQGLSLLVNGSGSNRDMLGRGAVLLAGLFGLLALQAVLRIVNETATSILQAESVQQINGRIMNKMSEVPYHLFEDNDFQARYGLLISQASYRPAMLVEAFVGSLSALAAAVAIALTLFALAPILDLFLLVLIPLSVAETRYHMRIIELQTQAAPALFRMTYLAQKSIDAAWQRDIRVHSSTILTDEYGVLARSYLDGLRALLRHYQSIRVAVGLAAAAIMTFAMAAVFWVANHSANGLAEAAILLPALVMGLSQGRSFAASWGVLTECLGYLAQLFEFLHYPFAESDMPARGTTSGAVRVPVAA